MMAGLFEKDVRLMLKSKQALAIFIFLAIFFSLSQQSVFTIAYLVCLCTIYTISTISYDESDNGYSFLMTLPITTRDYVFEKYLFCISGGAVAWVVSVALFIISSIVKNVHIEYAQELGEMVMLLLVAVMLASMLIPIQLRFGAEKSRVALIALMGIFFAGCYAVGSLMDNAGFNPDGLLAKLGEVPMAVWYTGFAVVAAAALAASVAYSLRIMNKREY